MKVNGKVNGNDSAHSFSWNEIHCDKAMPGIPIRLEIASRILAGPIGHQGYNEVEGLKLTGDEKSQVLSRSVLSLADALIKAHNETSGGD